MTDKQIVLILAMSFMVYWWGLLLYRIWSQRRYKRWYRRWNGGIWYFSGGEWDVVPKEPEDVRIVEDYVTIRPIPKSKIRVPLKRVTFEQALNNTAVANRELFKRLADK